MATLAEIKKDLLEAAARYAKAGHIEAATRALQAVQLTDQLKKSGS
jgi:hypothetical protein